MRMFNKYFHNIFFLFLFSFWPAINFTSININENLISSNIFFIALFVFLLSMICYFFFSFLLKKNIALIIISIGIISIFLFGGFESLYFQIIGKYENSAKIAMFLCFVLFIFLTYLVINLIKKYDYFMVMYVFIIVLYLPTIITLIYNFAQEPEVVKNTQIDSILPNDQLKFKNNHNVYFIILDAYAREDKLRNVLKFDNSKFLDQLRKRDFITSSKSLSNYNRTGLSISTAFNMDYYTSVNEYNNYLITSNSKTLQIFKSNKYDYVFIESGGNTEISCSGKENYCVKSGNFGDDVALFLKMTPVWRIIRSQSFNLYRYFESLYILTDIDHAIKMVINNYENKQNNYFAFAHILSPHEPQRFNQDCSKYLVINPELGEGSLDQYLNDLPCLNAQVIKTIDFILENDQTDPIILIHSDHGVAHILKGLNHEDKLLKLYNFMTFKLPKHCRENYYEDISLVNVMSLTFSCLSGNDPDFVEDRYFYAGYGERELQEVTNILKK